MRRLPLAHGPVVECYFFSSDISHCLLWTLANSNRAFPGAKEGKMTPQTAPWPKEQT